MLIRTVLAIKDTSFTLPPYKRSLQTIDPSSFTRLGWFSLPAIDQYSSLLPPVGVWSVSQYQCGVGDLPLRTPIHRRFGGPLPRQLPNGTHAYPSADASFNKYSHAGPLFYGVLIRLSPGYPPLMGKLHTRYSPVRRSPSLPCCHFRMLPLDLHVLSLSLAFILSQDQTLRCFKLFL